MDATASGAQTDSPLRLGGVTLRNRLVSAPMERNYCDPDGHLTDVYVDYLRQRAEAGVALVMAEATFVRQDGKGRTHQLGAHDDSCIPGLRGLAEALHAHGALVGCELNHGGRTAQSTVTGLPNVAPSPVPCEVAGGEVPRELTTAEIHELAEAYGDAAARCAAAGIDVLSIHAGHGYLVHQFLSPLYNHRSDEFAEPARFLNLVIDTVRRRAPDTTLGARLSVVEGSAGGLTAEQMLRIMDGVDVDRLDFLDLSAGSYEAGEWIVQSGEWAPGVLAEYAHAYRRFGRPLGLAGRLNSPEVVARVLGDGTCDFVSLARALHADPAFATACLTGSAYRPCIACNVCIDNLGSGPVGCSVNPTVGRGRLPLPTPRVGPGARARVVGAGPEGLTAARRLALAGVEVTLVEGRERIGGHMALAAGMRSTPDFRRFLDWSRQELTRLGVVVRTSERVDPSEIATDDGSGTPTILATGSPSPAGHLAEALGDCEGRVVDVSAWLEGHGTDAAPAAVTIWGADGVGMSVADTLASAGTAVLLVGEQEQIAPDSGRRAKILAVPRLEAAANVRIRLASTLVRLDDDRVLVRGADGTEEWLEAPGPVLVSRGHTTIRSAVMAGYDAAQDLACRL